MYYLTTEVNLWYSWKFLNKKRNCIEEGWDNSKFEGLRKVLCEKLNIQQGMDTTFGTE